MRVLLITDWLPNVGGAERYISGVRQRLRAAGDEVRLLTSCVGSAADGTAEYQAFGSEHIAARMILQIVNPFALATLRGALRDLRPDVALVNMYEHQLSPAVLAGPRGVPTVLSVSDYKGTCPIATKLLPSGRICREQAGAVCWRSGCVSFPHWVRDQPRYALIRSARKGVSRVLACSRWVQRGSRRAADHRDAPPGPTHGAPARSIQGDCDSAGLSQTRTAASSALVNSPLRRNASTMPIPITPNSSRTIPPEVGHADAAA